MSKPYLHSVSSAKQRGGTPEDYIEIHNFLDSSKSAFPDNRHRVLTHTSWFIGADGPLERAFGPEIRFPRVGQESEYQGLQRDIDALQREIDYLRALQRKHAVCVSVRDIGEQHCLEDFQHKFIPSAGDYLEHMEFQEWMNNGQKGVPTSATKTASRKTKIRTITLD